MTTRDITLASTPRPHPFTDVEQVLRDLAELEASLAHEIHRLQALHAPHCKSRGIARFLGKDVWWWRFRLVDWAYSSETERAHPSDVLAGLRLILKDLSDHEIISFLSNLSADPEPSTAA